MIVRISFPCSSAGESPPPEPSSAFIFDNSSSTSAPLVSCESWRSMSSWPMPGKGEVVLAEGDPALTEDEERLVLEFRPELDSGMWAAVPLEAATTGRREAMMVKDFREIPPDAERVIFFPRAAGG